MPRILDAALSTLWAITPDGLDALRTIYEQAISRTGSLDVEALERIMAENDELSMALHLTNGVTQGQNYSGTSKYTSIFSNGVAVVNLVGPIYPRANMMTSSGAVSLQQFTKEFIMAYEDPDVSGIVLNIDSPGGDARGLGDAANLMYGYSKKRKKPVKSFAAGYMASAAYYIGSIAQEIVGSKGSAYVGSIGTVLQARAKGAGEYEIVSSQSPHKRPDPSTEDGQAVMQQMVDDLAQIFIEDVAQFRNVTVEKVLSEYGQGQVLIGPRAKKQGLVDSLGTLDQVIEAVANEATTKSYRQSTKRVSAEVAEILSFTIEEKEDMGLRDLTLKFAASNETIFDEASDDQAQPDANGESESLDESGEGQETFQTREELEDSFSEAAELFATQMTLDNRVFPAQQAHVASDFLNARIDDTLHGGKVNFVNAEGEVVEGTREEAVRARYKAMPKHSMTQKAIKGIRDGSVQAKVLSEEEVEKPKSKDEGPLDADRREYLMSLSRQGQQVLAQSSSK